MLNYKQILIFTRIKIFFYQTIFETQCNFFNNFNMFGDKDLENSLDTL